MHSRNSRGTAITAALSALLLLVSFSGAAAAGGTATYRITILNLAPGQAFTPPLLALHKAKVGVFTVGEPASHGVRRSRRTATSTRSPWRSDRRRESGPSPPQARRSYRTVLRATSITAS